MLAQRSRTHPSRKRRLASMSGILAVLFLLLLGQGCCNPETPGPTGGKRTPPSDPNPKTGLTGGIPNPHNTCYMNSVLQVIARLYPDIFSGKSSALAQAGQALVDAIKDHKRNATKEKAEAFYKALLDVESSFTRGKQEDAHEALHAIFDECELPFARRKELFINKRDKSKTRYSAQKEGELGDKDVGYESWNMLQVSIGNATNTMQNLLDTSMEDKEHEDIKWSDGDTTNIAVESKFELYELDKLREGVLPIQVKRFATKGNPAVGDYERKKLNTLINDPFRITVKKEYQLPTTTPQNISYTLNAFILHSGGIKGGHYTAYVRNSEGQWVLYNDISVSTVTPDEAEQRASEAYLYFYKEVGASAAPEP